MFEYSEDGILCVHGGWLHEEGYMSRNNYDNYVRRGPFRVVRKGGGRNTPALIAWVSIHPDYQERIIEDHGDPTKAVKHIVFTDYLERDPKAKIFYASYTLDNGDPIADDIQKKYCTEASILNGVDKVINDRILRTKALGSGGMTVTWKRLADVIHHLPRHSWAHGLPKNHRSLERKFKAYKETGYEALIHGGHGHKNSEKLTNEAKRWVLSRWCNRVEKIASLPQLLDEYNEKALQEEWKLLKDEKTIYNYLYSPEVKSTWYGHRYGELAYKEKYTYQHSTKMPTLRDSLWYSDGTKLNLHYLDENGKMATCQVYEVMDAFSEVFLGYHISKTEDYQAQYFAYKMAVKNAGHRPYEIRYDGQGGHKKLESGNFLGKVAKLSIKTTPYNGKSKTIESAFGRFQQQIMKKYWFFTGQNITAKKLESKSNMEFILANAKNLPTLEEVKQAYLEARTEWNQSKHFKTGQPRIDMYYSSNNPKAPEINIFDMVDIFWIERPKPVTLTAYGLTFIEKNEKYTYMVYDENRLPDANFLNNNIDRKFHVKYDPDDMSLIYLYENIPNMGLRRVAAAEIKVEMHRGIQEQEAWEAEYFQKVAELNKTTRIQTRDKMDDILEEFGVLPDQYGLNSPMLKGLETKKSKGGSLEIGKYQKQVSNKVLVSEDEGEDLNWSDMM